MNFDATFWVAVSFFIFVGVLFYFKVPQKIFLALNESINKIKKDIEEAEKLKEDAFVATDYISQPYFVSQEKLYPNALNILRQKK